MYCYEFSKTHRISEEKHRDGVLVCRKLSRYTYSILRSQLVQSLTLPAVVQVLRECLRLVSGGTGPSTQPSSWSGQPLRTSAEATRA